MLQQNRSMKKYIPFLTLGFLLFFSTLTAQFNEKPILNIENEDKKFLNWGYYLGFNQYDFKFEYKDDINDLDNNQVLKNFGFNVGLIGEMNINEFLDIRLEPGLFYTQRDVGFLNTSYIAQVKSTYISVPLLLKVSTRRIGNWKPFIIGGVSYALNLGSNEKSLDDNESGTFRMTTDNYAYELGFGIDFYTEYFKFTPSIRGVFGLNDELVKDNDPNSPYTGNIESMKTRGIFVNFTFE